MGIGKGDSKNKKAYIDFDSEESYIGWLRCRLLCEFGIENEEYRTFILRHLGSDYASKLDFAAGRNNEPDLFIEQGDDYFHGLALQGYMDESLRISTASVYTPEPVAAYLVERGIFYALERNFEEKGVYGPDHGEFYEALGSILNENREMVIRTMDISAGSGLFLLKMLSVMERSLKTCISSEKEIKEILLRQVNYGIFANDLHKQGLELFLIVLLNRFLGTFEIEKINPAIFEGNAVSDLFLGDSYDLILGNPPYLGEKGNIDVFKNARMSNFGQRFYEAKMDYFYYFIHKAVEMLKPGGVASYVTTNYFTTADGARKLRTFLKEKALFREICMLEDVEIFSSAKGQHNMLFTIQKRPAYSRKTVLKTAKGKSDCFKEAVGKAETQKIDGESIYDSDGNIVLYENALFKDASRSIRRNAECSLGELCEVRQGLVSGCDRTSKRNIAAAKGDVPINEPVYVFESIGHVPENLKNSTFIKPFYKNSDINRYSLKESKRLILYVTSRKMEKEEKEYADAVIEHLNRYREILSRRREVINGARNWYELQWPRDEEIFKGPKIMVPHRAMENRFVYTEKICYASADIYFINGEMESNHMKALCCILNSSVVYFWLSNNGKRKGRQLELYHTPLKRVPIPRLTEQSVEWLSKAHDCDERDESLIDDFVCNLYRLDEKEKAAISSFKEKMRQ